MRKGSSVAPGDVGTSHGIATVSGCTLATSTAPAAEHLHRQMVDVPMDVYGLMVLNETPIPRYICAEKQ